MFKDIQRIEIEKQQKRINELTDIKELFAKKDILEFQIDSWNKKVENAKIRLKSFSIFDRLFKKNKNIENENGFSELSSYEKIKGELDILLKTLNDMQQELNQLIEQLSDYDRTENYEKLEIERKKLEEISKAKTIRELGYTPLDAIQALESRGIVPVLDESDMCISKNPRDYSSTKSLIGVHKTNYAPRDNRISTTRETDRRIDSSITIKGKEYNYSYSCNRNTTHMCMNGEVGSHALGDWNDTKYAVLVPFDDIQREQIVSANDADTFTRGTLNLQANAWILCPKDEVEEVIKNNPNVHVLGYDGNRVLGYGNALLSNLGYRYEAQADGFWENYYDQKEYEALMLREGFSITRHMYTHYYDDDEVLTEISKCVEIAKILRDNKDITLDDLMKNAENFPATSLLFGVGLKASDSLGGLHEGNKQIDVFIEEMKNAGFNIPEIYQKLLREFADRHSLDRYNSMDKEKLGWLDSKMGETKEEQEIIQNIKQNIPIDRYGNIDTLENFIKMLIYESASQSRSKGMHTMEEFAEKLKPKSGECKKEITFQQIGKETTTDFSSNPQPAITAIETLENGVRMQEEIKEGQTQGEE